MAQLNDLIVTGSSRFLNKIQGTAASAGMLTTSAGGAGTPVYFSDGKPVACTLSSISVGSATNATKATQDESGNNIKTNYASSLSISDHTITLKSKSGANLASVTVPDNDTTYSLGTSGQYMQLIPDSGDRISVVPNFAMQSARRIFVQGTQTAPTTGGAWTGNCPEILTANALTDGQEITYWLPLPTTGNATLNLKFGDGTSSGALNCYYGGTTRLTTHYGQGQAIHLTYRKNVKIPSTGTTTYTGWWADANYDSNSNNIDILQGTYTIPVAGATAGLKQYSLFAEDADGKYSSFTTQNGTAVTKTVNRTDYFDISKIYYCSTGGNYATNANIGTSIVRWAQPLVDLRYTLNISTNSLTARKPLYLVFDKTATTSNAISDTLYKLAGTGTTDWWTQTLPTSADGKIYAEISKAVYDGYRGDLSVTHKYYEYTDSLHSYDSISALEQNKRIPETLEITITDNNGTLSCDKTFTDIRTWIDQDGHYVDDIQARLSVVSTDVIEYEAKNVWYNYNNTTNIGYIYLYFDCGLVGFAQYQGTDFVQYLNIANSLQFAYAEGMQTTASSFGSHAEGSLSRATSTAAHAEGYYTTASGLYSHSEGTSAVASSTAAHAEGYQTTASGLYSHAEGDRTRASSDASHAEGTITTASGDKSHAEGGGTSASGSCSHAEGGGTTASNAYTHASGLYTIANADCQTAIGKYNSTVSDALFIVGKGTATNARSNAMYVTTAGNINCVSVTQTSDRRLKDNITNISTTDLAIYDKLQPKSFTLKSDDVKSKHYGFIAQDVLQSFEELGLPSSYVGIVHQDQNEQGYYNINYTEFIALLVEKQKIMEQEIDELKAAVAALKQHQS